MISCLRSRFSLQLDVRGFMFRKRTEGQLADATFRPEFVRLYLIYVIDVSCRALKFPPAKDAPVYYEIDLLI